jgi:hypothetical protein
MNLTKANKLRKIKYHKSENGYLDLDSLNNYLAKKQEYQRQDGINQMIESEVLKWNC